MSICSWQWSQNSHKWQLDLWWLPPCMAHQSVNSLVCIAIHRSMFLVTGGNYGLYGFPRENEETLLNCYSCPILIAVVNRLLGWRIILGWLSSYWHNYSNLASSLQTLLVLIGQLVGQMAMFVAYSLQGWPKWGLTSYRYSILQMTSWRLIRVRLFCRKSVFRVLIFIIF